MGNRKYLLTLTDLRSHCIGGKYTSSSYDLMGAFVFDNVTFIALTMDSAAALSDADYEFRVLNFLNYVGVESKKDIDSLLADSIT